MALLEVVYECPAYKVVKSEPRGWGQYAGAIMLKHGEEIALIGKHYRGAPLVYKYRVGTVLGCAIENWEDPDAAREVNRKNGGKDHWINACGASLTAHARPQEVLREINVGDLVCIEGHYYEIVAERNNNLGLKPAAEEVVNSAKAKMLQA